MKFKKSELTEIIDSNGELIGKNDIPTTGGDLETQANNTTDYNVKVAAQPYRYDFMSKMGFSYFPFYEGKENQSENELANDLYTVIYNTYFNILKYYYKNPNKLKSDYRKMSEDGTDARKEENHKIVNEIFENIEKHFKNAFKETIDESTVAEDVMIKEKSESEMSKKSEDREIKEKQLKKIAGLINKLDKEDMNNLINLLERK